MDYCEGLRFPAPSRRALLLGGAAFARLEPTCRNSPAPPTAATRG